MTGSLHGRPRIPTGFDCLLSVIGSKAPLLVDYWHIDPHYYRQLVLFVKPDSCSSKSKLEWLSDHGGDGQTSGVYNAETQVSSGFPDWDSGDWEESTDGGESERIISVRLGERTKRISIDGSSEAIRDAIQSAFGLKTWQDFWLEDESEIVRPLDRDMPLSAYTLHLTEGWLIKYCPSDDLKHTKCKTLEKDFYSQCDFSYFLLSHGWVGLKEPGDNKIVDMIDDLKSDVLYHGLDQ